MDPFDRPPAGGPILRSAWNVMSPAMRRTAVTAPAIPAIAARAKEIAAEHPGFIRGDQGQVVGVLPDKEIYYGPSSGLPELRRIVGRFWTLAYALEGTDGMPRGGLDLGVPVDERQVQAARQAPADTGLAGAHEADQDNRTVSERGPARRHGNPQVLGPYQRPSCHCHGDGRPIDCRKIAIVKT